MSSPLLEHNYIGLSEPSSETTTTAAITMAEKSDQNQSSSPPAGLNMKATELRLAPPGSESPERDAFPPEENDGKGTEYPLASLNNFVSGAKRGFSDAIDAKSERWASSGDGGGGSNKSGPGLKDVGVGSSMASEKKPQNHNSSTSAAAAVHASKTQVVGWPPIRSFRKNTMNPPPTKPHDKAEEAACLYVKVSMDGAPYLRKVDLNTYGSYAHLSASLNNMFSCFSTGENGLLKDHQSLDKCVLTYEDKDGDWMLVGDVPWDMFINTCRKLRITKPTEPIGSAPRALQKRNVDED